MLNFFGRFFHCLCVVVLAGAVHLFAQEDVPRFEKAQCPVPLPVGENAICGQLVVLENRKRKAGKTIRLSIVILKSSSQQPKADPVMRTFGGPGSSSMNLVRSRRSSSFLRDRDLIIFEQRGTKYAQPALDCPEVKQTNLSDAIRKLDVRTSLANEVGSAKVCYDRLIREGNDLSSYNTVENAADIEDLRRVLKIDKINLWGISYSTRLMLEVMRDHPEGIRSVVLESTLPLEVNYDEVGVDAIVRVFNEVFRNCRVDDACAKAYPDLEREFYTSVQRLDKAPIEVALRSSKNGESILLDGNDLTTWLIDYLFSNSPEAIADVPLVIDDVYHGNYTAFRKYADEKFDTSSSLGMRYSVWCGEEVSFESMAEITGQSSKYPGLSGYKVMSLPDICNVWKVKTAEPIENQAVKSSIPTMIITAEYDGYTPPRWGEAVSKNLKNSFIFQVPDTGHGPAFSIPCLGEMITAFFDDPRKRPDSSCIKQVKERFKFNIQKP